jgi:hypothetical protein
MSQDLVSKLTYNIYYELSSSIQLRIINERSLREKLFDCPLYIDKAYSMIVFPMIKHFVLYSIPNGGTLVSYNSEPLQCFIHHFRKPYIYIYIMPKRRNKNINEATRKCF